MYDDPVLNAVLYEAAQQVGQGPVRPAGPAPAPARQRPPHMIHPSHVIQPQQPPHMIRPPHSAHAVRPQTPLHFRTPSRV